MAFQTTVAANSCLFNRGISRPMIQVKLRRNACFSSFNSSSSSQAPLLAAHHHQDGLVRPLENYSPDMWGDRFVTLSFTNSELESCSRKVEDLKNKVKDMLMSSTDDPVQNILLINHLCRLGVSYHFEAEIEHQLTHLFTTLPPQLMDNYKDHDLHIVAVIFQVFRSHGYKIPCDVFNRFKNRNVFNEEVKSDIKGIISLYEASHWGTHGEQILDESLDFTKHHLKSLVVSQSSCSCPHHVREYITHALKFPHHKGIPRLEARNYISYYEQNELKNDILLKFAKYDFNRVQMLHQQELSLLSSWVEKSDITLKFPHVRHRLVESFFIVIETLFEPRFALARSITCKWYIAFTILDDTYDAYGFFEELQHLTKAIKRFDRSAMDELPGEYFKNIYQSILNITAQVEEDVSKENRAFTFPYLKAEIQRMVEYYDAQSRWSHEHILPPLDEYLDIGLKSIGLNMTMILLMMGMEEADEDAYRWITNCDDKFVRASCMLCRIFNDIKSNEAEVERGKVSWTACYMKEYNVSKEEAMEGYRELIRSCWKDMNDAFMVKPLPVPRRFFIQAWNVARIADVLYELDDGYTKQISLKHHIAKVLIDAIPLEE